MSKVEAGSAWRAARLSWTLLKPGEKRYAVIIALGHALASFIDTVSLVGVMPLITVIIEPGSVATNWWLQPLYAFLGEPEQGTLILQLATGAILLLGFGVGSSLLVKLAVKRFGVACQERLARDLMSLCVQAPYQWFLSQNATSLARLVYSDVLMWSNNGVQRIIAVVSHVSLLAFAIAVIFIGAQMAGVTGIIGIGVVATVVMLAIRSRVRYLSHFRRTADAKCMTVANEILAGIKDVKMSGRSLVFVDLYVRAFNVYSKSMATLHFLQAIPPMVMLFLGQAAIIIIAVTLWRLGNSSGEIAAQMALVLLVTSRAIPATVRLSNEINAMWNVIPHIEGIFTLMRETHVSADKESKRLTGKAIPDDWQKIELSELGFTYTGTKAIALHGISAVFERGKSYGIAGPSGAGKTTLIDIMLGLLWPSEGALLIDGIPLSQYDARSWQHRVGYVPQAPMISDDTLIGNVAFGVPSNERDEQRVLRCLDMANLGGLHKTIGLHGQLGDRGSHLSGGERQRVAIARALYDEPDILVLDEATSALDGLNEREVLAAIKGLHGVVTTVIIAHRLSTIEHCDEILLLENGALAGKGKHGELIRTSSLFRTMADANSPAESNVMVTTG